MTLAVILVEIVNVSVPPSVPTLTLATSIMYISSGDTKDFVQYNVKLVKSIKHAAQFIQQNVVENVTRPFCHLCDALKVVSAPKTTLSLTMENVSKKLNARVLLMELNIQMEQKPLTWNARHVSAKMVA
jgi:hypothetical protein